MKQYRVTYPFGIETHHSAPRAFFSDYIGGYYYFTHDSYSHYAGSAIPIPTQDGWHMYKVLHSFAPYNFVGMHYKHTSFSLFFPNGKLKVYPRVNGLFYQVRGVVTIPLELDPRHIYDEREFGRFMHITRAEHDSDIIVICYERRCENSTQVEHIPDSQITDRVYVAVKTDAKVTEVANWVPKNFELEQKRNASPKHWHVFHAVTITSQDHKIKKLAVAYSFSKSEAVRLCSEYYTQEKVGITHTYSHLVRNQPLLPFSVPKQFETSAMGAYHALDKLCVSVHPFSFTNQKVFGLYAGLPWFFQFWSRDEAISLIALIRIGRNDLVKDVLLRLIGTVNEHGLIANRFPHSGLGSADSIGWVCKRITDLLNADETIFSEAELKHIHAKLHESYLARKKSLIYSGKLETWMDTGAGYDERDGYCIEIQALWATQLSLLIRISQKVGYLSGEYIETLRDFLAQVRTAFFQKETNTIVDRVYESDGERVQDIAVRPNVLLAYYIYPELFSYDIWQKTAQVCIDELWCEWGGLATISKHHSLYKDTYAGQTNESYHRGDVWYFVNAISAIVLQRLGFTSHSDSLIQSLDSEIVAFGALGGASEVSDAKEHSSHGCDLQLWSNALYLDALYSLYKK